MNQKKVEKLSAFIDIINGSLIITILVFILILSNKNTSLEISSSVGVLLISIIYLFGIYVSRYSLLSTNNTSLKKRLFTNTFLILITVLCQFFVLNITGYWFIMNLSHLILINIVFVIVLGSIFHFSFKFFSNFKKND